MYLRTHTCTALYGNMLSPYQTYSPFPPDRDGITRTGVRLQSVVQALGSQPRVGACSLHAARCSRTSAHPGPMSVIFDLDQIGHSARSNQVLNRFVAAINRVFV